MLDISHGIRGCSDVWILCADKYPTVFHFHVPVKPALKWHQTHYIYPSLLLGNGLWGSSSYFAWHMMWFPLTVQINLFCTLFKYTSRYSGAYSKQKFANSLQSCSNPLYVIQGDRAIMQLFSILLLNCTCWLLLLAWMAKVVLLGNLCLLISNTYIT